MSLWFVKSVFSLQIGGWVRVKVWKKGIKEKSEVFFFVFVFVF